jgi:hypothetical protein
MQRFHVKGKLAPLYISPFKILERRGEMSYKLELPVELSEFHDVFHVSQLHKCLQVPSKPETSKRSTTTPLTSTMTLPIERDQSASLKKMFVLPVDARSKCTRCNGVTILKLRPLGNARIISNENSPNYFTLSYRILGRDSF